MHQPISSFLVGHAVLPRLRVGHEVELVELLDRTVAGWHSTPAGRDGCVRNFTCSGSRWICSHWIGFCVFPVLLQDADALDLVVVAAGTAEWQPMQSSTDGTPAACDRSVPEWQYWQSIPNSPAWCLWLKGIGWIGPGRFGIPGCLVRSGRRSSDGNGLSNSAGSRSRGRARRPSAPSAPGLRRRCSPPAQHRLRRAPGRRARWLPTAAASAATTSATSHVG